MIHNLAALIRYATLSIFQSNTIRSGKKLPDIVIFKDGKITFEFYTSDFRTTYSVVIEGMTSDGRILRQVGGITGISKNCFGYHFLIKY